MRSRLADALLVEKGVDVNNVTDKLTFAALKTTCTRLIMHLRPGRAADVMQRLHTYAPCSDSCLRQMNSAWTEIVRTASEIE
jgi:hypothetical protein